MTGLFPFSLPGATATYLWLYMLTLTVHMLLIGYVLAGSGYLGLAIARGRGRDSLVPGVLRDWLPFALGAAITAGVAPLLFLQILYKESFYTANLLLFHRFMAVVPVLIVGFYLLYLNKSETVARWPRWRASAVAIGAFACFVFTGYTWIENHLLALDRGAWIGMYGRGEMVHSQLESIPRLLFWLASSAAITAVWLGWQLRARRDPRSDDAADDLADPSRNLALMGILGIGLAMAALVWYALVTQRPTQILADVALPYLILGLVAALAGILAWATIWRSRQLGRKALVLASASAVLATLATIVLREAMRAEEVGIHDLVEIHERAARAEGFWLFLCCVAVAVAVIAWCFAMTARALRAGPDA